VSTASKVNCRRCTSNPATITPGLTPTSNAMFAGMRAVSSTTDAIPSLTVGASCFGARGYQPRAPSTRSFDAEGPTTCCHPHRAATGRSLHSWEKQELVLARCWLTSAAFHGLDWSSADTRADANAGRAGRDGEDLRFAKVATAALATGDGGGWHIRPPCFVTISGMSAC
jgi:hypothetical protein